MRQIATVLLLLLASTSARSVQSCSVTERDLLGAWSSGGGSGFFEEFSLEKVADSRTFNSWLHESPELSNATWKLENCQLTVTPQHGEFDPFRFKVLGLKNGKLRLYDESDHIESVYVRLPREP
jgi:hypothetical protein